MHCRAQAAPQADSLGEDFGNCCAQLELVTALQWYLKTLLKGRAPKAALFLWATAPWVDAIIQLHSNKSQFTYKLDIQLVPSACRWLHITQPLWEEPAASPLCSDCCFTHCAVAGPLNNTGQQLAGWLMVSEVSGWAGAHRHSTCALLDLPCPGPLNPLKLRGGTHTGLLREIRPRFFLFYQQQNNYKIHTCTHITYKSGMIWLQFVLNECHFLLCAVKASDYWSNILQGDSLPRHGKSHLAFHTFRESYFFAIHTAPGTNA